MPSSTADSLAHLALSLDASDDAAAIEAEVLALFDEYAVPLTRYVISCGLNADAADDVVQDAYMALFRHLRLGRPRDSLRGWLFTVAHRLAQKQRSRSARRRAVECAIDPHAFDEVSASTSDPETMLVAGETGRRLRSAFRALPERHRHCLLLRAEGLRYREIAGVLGISLGGVAKALSCAVLRLSVVAGD